MVTIFTIQSVVTDESEQDSFIQSPAGKLLGTQGPWLAGGSLRRAYAGEDTDGMDFDIFFHDEEQAKKYVSCLISQHGYIERDAFEGMVILESPQGHKIQCVMLEYYSEMSAVINSFDNTVSQFVTDGVVVMAGERTAEDVKAGVYNPVNIKFPDHVEKRIEKLAKHGYKPSQHFMDVLKRVKERGTAPKSPWSGYAARQTFQVAAPTQETGGTIVLNNMSTIQLPPMPSQMYTFTTSTSTTPKRTYKRGYSISFDEWY